MKTFSSDSSLPTFFSLKRMVDFVTRKIEDIEQHHNFPRKALPLRMEKCTIICCHILASCLFVNSLEHYCKARGFLLASLFMKENSGSCMALLNSSMQLSMLAICHIFLQLFAWCWKFLSPFTWNSKTLCSLVLGSPFPRGRFTIRKGDSPIHY